MKAAEREVYQIVANQADFSLCPFCKYADFLGSCCDGEIECHHPLHGKWNFERQEESAADLGDCWGFGPRYNLSFVADIIGITLAQGWDGGASWWQDDQGWHITGTKLVI